MILHSAGQPRRYPSEFRVGNSDEIVIHQCAEADQLRQVITTLSSATGIDVEHMGLAKPRHGMGLLKIPQLAWDEDKVPPYVDINGYDFIQRFVFLVQQLHNLLAQVSTHADNRNRYGQ